MPRSTMWSSTSEVSGTILMKIDAKLEEIVRQLKGDDNGEAEP